MEAEPIPLSMKQIQEAIYHLNGWEIEEGKLEKEFRFVDFKQAKEFIDKLAVLAEQEEHHPDIFWWYNKAKLVLFTHRIKSISQLDTILAEKIDKL